MCCGLFDHHVTKASAGRRDDRRSIAFLPLELKPRFSTGTLDRPMNRDLAVRQGQRTVLSGIGSEFMHNEREGLRYPGVQQHIGAIRLDLFGESLELETDDLGDGRAFESSRQERRLAARKCLYTMRQHFARLGERSCPRKAVGRD